MPRARLAQPRPLDIEGIPCYVHQTEPGQFYTCHAPTHLTIGAGPTPSASNRIGVAYIRRHGLRAIIREIEYRVERGWTPPPGRGSLLEGQSAAQIADLYTQWLATAKA